MWGWKRYNCVKREREMEEKLGDFAVAPGEGAWIEIFMSKDMSNIICSSLPVRERTLKYKKFHFSVSESLLISLYLYRGRHSLWKERKEKAVILRVIDGYGGPAGPV